MKSTTLAQVQDSPQGCASHVWQGHGLPDLCSAWENIPPHVDARLHFRVGGQSCRCGQLGDWP